MNNEKEYMEFSDDTVSTEEDVLNNFTLCDIDSFDEENDDTDCKIEDPAEEDCGYVKMDFSLVTPEDRVQKVNEIISKTPPERLTPKYLEKLTDYIIFAMDKQERQQKRILTDNRMITINKRETSFEGLVSHFENNENTGDVIYNMIANDKNIIFRPKFEITEEDIKEVPGLKELREEIDKLELKCKSLRGKAAYNMKKQIISMRQDQYVMKNSYKPISINCTNTIKSFKKLDLSEKIYLDEEENVVSTGFLNFFNPNHISALLCNYEKLQIENWANCMGDAKWMLIDFENLINKTFENNPVLKDIAYGKMYSYTNLEIQNMLKEKYGSTYSIEYLSSLWRNKIPKMIAETASEEWLIWHYTFEEKGYWKKCSKCGQIKLGINRFFSKNNASKDKLYSICKECRNKKITTNKIKYGTNL